MRNTIVLKGKFLFYTAYFLIVLGSAHLSAQVRCEDALYEANKQWDQGHFEAVEKILAPCLKSRGIEKQERFDAWRLMGLAYIYRHQDALADSSIYRLLKSNPAYLRFPYPDDPAEFTARLSGFQVRPLITFQPSVGVNISTASRVRSFSPSGSAMSYRSALGYSFGAAMILHLKPPFHLSSGIMYSGIQYRKEVENVAGWNQEYTEALQNISVPLLLGYTIRGTHVSVKGEAGVDLNFLQSAHATLQATDLTYGGKRYSTNNTYGRRNQTRVSLNACAALLVPAGDGRFVFTVGQHISLTNAVNPDQRYADQNFMIENQYVDDDFRLHYTDFLVGYEVTLFHQVKKIK